MSGSRPVGKMIDGLVAPYQRGTKQCADCQATFIAKTTAKYCIECRVKRMDRHNREGARDYRKRKRNEQTKI